jgi:hypothetical protein
VGPDRAVAVTHVKLIHLGVIATTPLGPPMLQPGVTAGTTPPNPISAPVVRNGREREVFVAIHADESTGRQVESSRSYRTVGCAGEVGGSRGPTPQRQQTVSPRQIHRSLLSGQF